MRNSWNPYWSNNARAHEAEFRAILRLMKVAEKGITIDQLIALYTDREFDGWWICDFRAAGDGQFLLEWNWGTAGSTDLYVVKEGEAVHTWIVRRDHGGEFGSIISGQPRAGVPLLPANKPAPHYW